VFFFQAEDGIRDRNVTGVQTCALPICDLCGIGGVSAGQHLYFCLPAAVRYDQRCVQHHLYRYAALGGLENARQTAACQEELSFRSEERRVGKESRSVLGQDGEAENYKE